MWLKWALIFSALVCRGVLEGVKLLYLQTVPAGVLHKSTEVNEDSCYSLFFFFLQTFTAGGFEVTEAVQLRQCGFREEGSMVGRRPASAVCNVTPSLLGCVSKRSCSCKDQLALVNNQGSALARSVARGCHVYSPKANATLPSDILTV